MSTYIRNHVWDYLICLIMSAALAFNVFAGYEIKDPKALSILSVGAVCAVSMILLFAAGYNRITTLAGIGTAVVVIVISVIMVRTYYSKGEGRIDDNPALFWLVTIGVSVVCYLLSRWRIGIAVLLTAGSIMSAAFGFLKYPVSGPAFIVFLSAVILVFLYRVYNISLLASYTGSVRFTRYTMQSAAFVLVIVLAAGAVYAGIIRPLNPPTHPLKLITKLESLEILQQVGVSSRTEVPDPDQTTENENENKETTNQKENQNEDQSPQEEKDDNLQGEIKQQTDTEKAQAVNYRRDRTWFYVTIAFLIALAAVLPFVLRYFLRRRWERKVKEAGPTEGSVMVYSYLLKKLRYAGFTKPPGITLFRYMKGQRKAMKTFAVGSTDLFALTRLYQQVLYGCRELEEADFARFWKVYSAFRGNMKNKLGKVRYLLRFFFI